MYLQAMTRGLADCNDNSNKSNNLTDIVKSPAVDSQSSADAVEEVGLPIPVVCRTVIAPASELYSC